MKTIDGSRGEGGGQVLRTTLGLAMISGEPVRLQNIRAGRAKPGLMRQHLTSVRAAAAICGAQVRGAELGSQTLEFVPGEIRGGEYEFAVGTAGSVALVLQTVAPALFVSGVAARLLIEGGTHAKMAPPFEFLRDAYGRMVRAVGFGFDVELERYGFFPAGGGRIVAAISPGAAPQRLDLREGRFDSLRAVATLAGVPEHVAKRELHGLYEAFAAREIDKAFDTVACTARSPGNTLHVRLDAPNVTEVFTAFGERGVRAESLAAELGAEVGAFLDAGVPVGEHLADQLMVLLSVAAGGVYRTVPLTLHSRTLVDLVPELIDVEIVVREEPGGNVEVEVNV